VFFRKILQCLGNLGQQFDVMIGNRMRETANLLAQVRSDGIHAEPLKRMYQRMCKAVQSVAVLHDTFALHIVEHLAHLFGRKLVVIEKRNKLGDRPLKVDVIFPERIVSVDEQSLGIQLLAPGC
jgi:hypothetical protein